MIVKDLKINNFRGDSITFGRHFFLDGEIDFSNLQASVNYSESTKDGSNYQNTILDNREFDILFFIKHSIKESWAIEESRNEAYKVFNPKSNPFRLDFTTKSGEEYYINANLQGSPTFATEEEDSNEFWQNGLLQFSANDPYIYKKDTTAIDVALWIPAFEFPLEFTGAGIEFGHRAQSTVINVYNGGQDATGMTIRFKVTGTVTNPSITNVNTLEVLKLNTTMQTGDAIEITTYKANKKIKLIRAGVETNIFNTLDLSSKFLQLGVGDNLLRYDATGGVGNLLVSINFTPRLLGV